MDEETKIAAHVKKAEYRMKIALRLLAAGGLIYLGIFVFKSLSAN